jgi:hypothetical protein
MAAQHVLHMQKSSAFASWLGLCPQKQISGRKILYTRTRPVRNRVALALRLGANSLHHADNYLGNFFRRMKRKIGKPPAVTATAHKLACIIFHLLTHKEEYNDGIFFDSEKEASIRMAARLRKQAAALGFQIVPVTSANV